MPRPALSSLSNLTRQSSPLHLVPLLRALGLELPPKKTKLVRHQDRRYDVGRLVAAGQLDLYQSNQGRAIFNDCEFLLAFSADGGSRSELLGLYRVLGVTEDRVRGWPADFIYKNEEVGPFWYETVKDNALRSLEGRLVIEWGAGTRAWHQWLNPDQDKVVLEIKAPGRHLPFPGYDDVVLSFEDLHRIVENPASNLDWLHALSKVSGVYLIQDTESGDLYVGSAYGTAGIWGRWTTYAETCHGGNIQLHDLCKNYPGRHRGFRYSILKTMPLSADKEQVISVETTWKQKLGTRAFGLNSN